MCTGPVGSFTETFRSCAGGVLHGRQRERVEVVGGIPLLLPAIGIEHLAEIALLVEQADADQRVILIAGGFQVIP